MSLEKDSACSSNRLAVGNDAERLQWIVVSHIEGIQMRVMFWDISKTTNMDEITCREALRLLRSVNEDERAQCCKTTLALLSNRDDNEYIQIEQILSSIFMYAYEHGALSLSECCELLILNTNFTLSTPMETRKFEFMQKNIHLIDYKGLRNILKLLVVERMQEIPANITHSHRQMLLPVENLLLSLIDRNMNLLPCLFTITELHRVSNNSRAFLLPRIAKKFNEIFTSFRPLTEMVSVVGRPWLYPIPAHISFPSSTSSWRLEVATTRLHQRAHLPYRSELFAPQSSLLYTLLRQPRGKDTIAFVMRQNTGTSPQKVQCDDLLHMIVMEAMSEMEKTVHSLENAAVQYQWMNITQTVTFSLLHGNASFPRLIKLLTESLSAKGYRKGRDELMWIVLQYVAVYVTKINEEDMACVGDLYNLLYSDARTWTGIDTDIWQFVRFLTPAAIWIHFYKANVRADQIPKPPEALLCHIRFLEERTTDTDPMLSVADHNALLAALANAHSNDMVIFQKFVLSSIDAFLDGSSDESWNLPYGITSSARKIPLPFSLIDCLTYHARNHLLQVCIAKMSALFGSHSSSKLPSPASMETMIRLAVTTEFEYGVKQLLTLLSRSLTSMTAGGNNPADRSKDLSYILSEVFCYRLISFPLPVISKVNIIMQCYSAVSYPQIQLNFSLYTVLEQILLRYWIWNTPSELSVLCTALFGKQGKFTAVIAPPSSFCEMPHMSNSSAGHERQHNPLHISPEALRFILLCMFRGLKMTGSELPMEVLQRCNAGYAWPLSISRVFSAQIPKCTVDDGNDENYVEDILHILNHDMHQIRELSYTTAMLAEDQLAKYFSAEKKSALLCVLYTLLSDVKKVHPVYYGILASCNIKEIIVMINRFVDYLMHMFRRNPPIEDATFNAVASVINDMVFTHQLIPLDRLLLSLILHPTDDRSIEYSMLIIHSLASIFTDLHARIVFICRHVPSNKIINTGVAFFTKLVEYHVTFPEYNYREMEAMRRIEMQKEMGLRATESQILNPEYHLPTYYGNVVERILPIVDMILVRALDPVVSEQLFSSLLSAYKTVYKFHPQPTSFLYNVLYTQDQCVLHSSKARFFVLEVCSQLEERDGGFSIISSAKFDTHPTQLCQQLVARVIQASFYPHEPPPFAQKDWRFAELPPSSQALLGACIELLISPHNPTTITRSLIDIVLVRPLQQPYTVINTVALILTSLPPPYQHVFYEHLVSVLNSDALLEGDPSACFDSLENECFLLNENQLITNLALAHAYLQHCNNSALGALPEFVREHLAPKLTNEAQLIFVLRLVIPILQRFYDAKERSKQIQDLAVDVYKMTVRVNKLVGSLKYEDSICDLLYHMKYMYVGDFVRNEAEQAIQLLSPSMQKKLKYISHTQTANPDSSAHK